jgi:NAD(P)-dependent dehydrogenase (short-subunit alcohol dehydrogenase family)
MNRTILVTGAGRGLGYSVILRHVELQDEVHAFDREISDELKQLSKNSLHTHAMHCDISSTESVSLALGDLLRAGKKIDILYNVAGVYRFEDKVGLAETDLDLCASMYNINAVGPLRICRAALPLLQAGSLIVNISSEAGSIGACRRSGEYAYCMSKAAMNMGAKILSNELARRSVRVLMVHPGWLRTVIGGPAAQKSSASISPDESARNIVDIALRIDEIPRDQMYMKHTGELMPW